MLHNIKILMFCIILGIFVGFAIHQIKKIDSMNNPTCHQVIEIDGIYLNMPFEYKDVIVKDIKHINENFVITYNRNNKDVIISGNKIEFENYVCKLNPIEAICHHPINKLLMTIETIIDFSL